ncbi:MAG: type II toxin-antitoxin system VapC family toxin [Boseongicola sp. SB0677_bin_26]|nr:type II toxin-antitoxin system VapC family toxin [Boseongicola sp. SB0677_bin_26]
MIALDANVLVRYLVDDHPQQAGAARKLMAELTSESRGFVCREVSVELARILDRAYGFSPNRIATVFEELAATSEIHLEAADDTIRAADSCRRGGPDFAEQMIAAAAKRSSADFLYTLDRQDGQLRATALLPAARR